MPQLRGFIVVKVIIGKVFEILGGSLIELSDPLELALVLKWKLNRLFLLLESISVRGSLQGALLAVLRGQVRVAHRVVVESKLKVGVSVLIRTGHESVLAHGRGIVVLTISVTAFHTV